VSFDFGPSGCPASCQLAVWLILPA